MSVAAGPIRSGEVVTRSRLGDLLAPESFLWATGIEDTFITDPHRGTGRTLDEYALTQHYDRWSEDLDLIASLGVAYARYGVPWYRVEPSPGNFDFSWSDQVFDRMLELGVQPIVDLMHYGTPAWLNGGFGNPEYPERVAEYARRIGERYRGRVTWYTPLNEPRITAYYCGRIGWWPPYGRSWRDFVSVMVSICKGICLTQRALRQADSEIVLAHVDATDLYEAEAPIHQREADFRQELVFLALDLIMGRASSPGHALARWLTEKGLSGADLDWFDAHDVVPDTIGLNLYPMFTDKLVTSTRSGTRIRMRYGSAQLIPRLAEMYWSRYGIPLWISETAAVGRRRAQWLNDSLDAVRATRQNGIPLFGYAWWPLFALIAWSYRQKELPLDRYLLQLGLWDLRLGNEGELNRIATKLVEVYRDAVRAGSGRVGELRLNV